MTEHQHDERIRGLVRRAHDADAAAAAFDVEAGLAEVLGRVGVAATRGGSTTVVTGRADTDWRRLTGSERNAACLVAVRAGDRAAFAALVRDLTPLVWHVARGNGLGRAEAEDVVQTVWLALLRHVDRLADPKALAAWLITTTRREAHRTQRRATRVRHVAIDDVGTGELASAEPLPEDVVVRADRDRELWAAFHQLSERCQEMLRLTVLAGRAEYRAVAEALRMPVGSIGPTRGRCLRTLHGLYQREVDR